MTMDKLAPGGCCPSVYNDLTSAALYMHVNDSVTICSLVN